MTDQQDNFLGIKVRESDALEPGEILFIASDKDAGTVSAMIFKTSVEQDDSTDEQPVKPPEHQAAPHPR